MRLGVAPGPQGGAGVHGERGEKGGRVGRARWRLFFGSFALFSFLLFHRAGGQGAGMPTGHSKPGCTGLGAGGVLVTGSSGSASGFGSGGGAWHLGGDNNPITFSLSAN